MTRVRVPRLRRPRLHRPRLRRSLRTRLVLTSVVLAAAGIVAVNAVVAVTLQSSLLDRVDAELAAARRPGPPPPGAGQQPPAQDPGTTDRQLLDDRVLVRLDATTGAVLDQVAGPTVGAGRLPDVTALSAGLAAGGALPTGRFRLDAVDGSTGRYLATVLTEPGTSTTASGSAASGSGGVVVLAKSLDDVTATVRRVVLVDAGVSALVLALLVGAGAVVVRLGLRPLSDVEEAAGRIAAGDLTVRAPHAADRTEVGSLARTFNTMVARIEEAFAARGASEQRLRQFLADASHELRTPLTSIRAYSELFRSGVLTADEPSASALARIEAEATRMGGLVEDLLLLARLDQQPVLRDEDVDLAEVADDVGAAVAATAPGHRVSVEASAQAWVRGDPEALRRALVNLVRNAVVHTPAGTAVRVEVSAARPGTADDVVVVVEDDGPGMPADVAAHAFDRFYRPDAGRSRSTAGTGLGLAIVESIVTTHGGRVALDTAPGRGARFTVRLPAAPPAADVPAEAADEEPDTVPDDVPAFSGVRAGG
jgi:two-component system, OmpR family, sensor kinase